MLVWVVLVFTTVLSVHMWLWSKGLLLSRLTDIANISEEKNLPFVMWFGPSPVLIFVDIDDVKAVTNAFVDKPYYYSFGKIWLGEGLVTASVPIWKHNIKILSGTFTSSVVAGYQSVYNAQAQRLVSTLRARAGAEPFDALHILALVTLETICQTALGECGVSERIVSKEYYNAFDRAVTLLMARGLNLLLHPDAVYRLTPGHREITNCVGLMHSIADTIIAKRRKEWDEKKKQGLKDAKESGNFDQTRFKSFLEILFEISERDPSMTPQQVRAEVDTILVAGQETVATALFYALLMIGCHSDVQHRLYSE
ncbi:hypothetical protein ACJJTC_016205 [Scirpophaga incertulas]